MKKLLLTGLTGFVFSTGSLLADWVTVAKETVSKLELRRGRAARSGLGLTGCIAVLILLAAFSPPAGAWVETRLNDPFTDGADTDGADPLDTNWYGLESAIDSGLPPTVDGGTLVTRIHDAALGEFKSVTLAFPGDYVEVSADIRSVNTLADATDSGWVLGLFNSRGTPLTYDIDSNGGDTAPVADDDGYWVTKFVDGDDTTDDFLIKEAVDKLRGGIFQWEDTTLSTTGTGINATDESSHEIGLRITLADNRADLEVYAWFDTYNTTYTYVGGATGSVGLTFDEVVIGGASGQSDLQTRIDNILVTTNVPEPASAALVLLGAAAMLNRRRRR
mgnify:CR=1 FL=1